MHEAAKLLERRLYYKNIKKIGWSSFQSNKMDIMGARVLVLPAIVVEVGRVRVAR